MTKKIFIKIILISLVSTIVFSFSFFLLNQLPTLQKGLEKRLEKLDKNSHTREQIEVTVTDVHSRHFSVWLPTKIPKLEERCSLEVHSDDYDMTENFDYYTYSSVQKAKALSEGDVVKATLHTVTDPDTNKVVQQYIEEVIFEEE